MLFMHEIYEKWFKIRKEQDKEKKNGQNIIKMEKQKESSGEKEEKHVKNRKERNVIGL